MAERSICQQARAITLADVAIVICALALVGAAAQAQTPQQSNPPEAGEQAPGKTLPEAPEVQKEKVPKNENAGPVGMVTGETKKAAELTEHVATEELLRARGWEATWISGVYLGKNQKLLALTKKEREEIY
ncbi:MAG: hypothetical protein WAK56_04155, partial [Candidatus Sulfotelmatobacter sp.]